MMPLARLWTWIGNLFIPLAIGWALFVQNGFGDKPPPDGVLISRGYWGLLVSLLAGSALVWTAALYARQAKKARARILVPPNTAFEDAKDRSKVITYGTACIFTMVVLLALVIFGSRYSDSLIHGWNALSPLQQGFWASRVTAHAVGCASQPCFSVARRTEQGGGKVFGVNEYILYLTDGVLAVLAVLLVSGLIYLRIIRRRNVARD
ncbi:hypothetical protein EDE08_13110 [Bradyrhizobium sp. R2.2-H]|jgi:hypothetical protein|uniref:hypothetical protein n=1 Tax=unclassified Bradyrhizobium TaxID=2631580 RepID=UPI00104E28D3|nr:MULTISPECIES: hypothetical protein [unclassified Bradyrhizobium]TCU58366.1 hypothetical protein EDE10_13310 [Bradyrhizobium sp. Y-H1]TCU63001.1 hypothetical protein EDE08_13110 [Bradyrhizobium sp. R2.2-H]